MINFINWLSATFSVLPLVDPFYQERSLAFQKLCDNAFREGQKEHYKHLSFKELLGACMDQVYHPQPILVDDRSISAVGCPYVEKKNVLTFINGIWSAKQSGFGDLSSQGLRLRCLSDMPLVEQQAIVTEYNADLRVSDDCFALLNRMLAPETYILEIPDHVDLLDVLYIEHMITEEATHVLPQLIIRLGKTSKATIVETWEGTAAHTSPFVNALTHITLSEAAHVSYYTLHMEDLPGHQVNHLYVNQAHDSHFTHHAFSFGGSLLRMNLTAQIKGSRAAAHLYGLYSLCKNEKIDHRIQVIHSAPNSFSKQHYKGILGGTSLGGFNGKIYLTPEAQQTHAFQANQVIMVSDQAAHYGKPQLEIYADDVKCSHGVTVGQLDPEQLFYLQTRGIAPDLAKKLLLSAFGKEIIGFTAMSELQHYLLERFEEQLWQLA
ncbi:MAG: SufD family Fe-S cluster assembly protein [Amoebophilaceae bacterium]|nr:SufD family Fe-S cluster assembly protein [Amoebophilaceae bacterium]